MANIKLVYFSPAMSTMNIVRQIGKATEMNIACEYNITQGLSESPTFTADDLVVIGVPVYSGRVPFLAANTLKQLKGSNTPTVVVCVYGNRDYDDALLELKNICEENQFRVIAGGAFIARHSIFPKVAENRPDERDEQKIKEFALQCVAEYQKAICSNQPVSIYIKGKQPYRDTRKIPLTPKASSACNKCGTCAKQCPVGAIPEDNPQKTNKAICISCTRCIAVCPEKARRFKGLMYRIASKKFGSAYVERKEPEFFFPN